MTLAKLPNKSYKKDKEFDLNVLLPFGIFIAIIFKLLAGSFISSKLLIPVFGMIVLIVIISIKKSHLNEGKRCIEQYFIFLKFFVSKIKERILRHYV